MATPSPGITVDDAGRIIEWSCLCTRDADGKIVVYNDDCPLGHRRDGCQLFGDAWKPGAAR